MKRLLKFSLILIAFATIITACSDGDDDVDNVINTSSLPQASKNFVAEHFPNQTITLAKETAVADPITRSKYFVYLTNGYEIDFDNSGAWVSVEVDGRATELPASVLNLLPVAALQYTRTNYPTALIKEITKLTINNQLRYDIELNNDLDLIFNADGQYLAINN